MKWSDGLAWSMVESQDDFLGRDELWWIQWPYDMKMMNMTNEHDIWDETQIFYPWSLLQNSWMYYGKVGFYGHFSESCEDEQFGKNKWSCLWLNSWLLEALRWCLMCLIWVFWSCNKTRLRFLFEKEFAIRLRTAQW